jgi:hypothetical protein
VRERVVSPEKRLTSGTFYIGIGMHRTRLRIRSFWILKMTHTRQIKTGSCGFPYYLEKNDKILYEGGHHLKIKRSGVVGYLTEGEKEFVSLRERDEYRG